MYFIGRKQSNLCSCQLTIHCLQRSCELGARFADLEKKQIQLNLDLALAKENLQKAKDETAGMGGKNLPTVALVIFFFLLLNQILFLSEKMKQALDQKDLDLAAAQKMAQEKIALADKKLASVGKLEEDNAKLKAALDEANKEAT